MNSSAKKTWIQFFNSIESGLKPQGQWIEVKDFASKAAENAIRLAALFHIFSGKSDNISVESIEQAVAIIQWHMQEARRLLEPQAIKPSLEDARLLLQWLMRRKGQQTSVREILQLSPLRNKTQRDNALETLIEHQHIRLIKQGNKMLIKMNPYSK